MDKIIFTKTINDILCEIVYDPATQIAEVKASGKVYFEFEATVENIHDPLVQECAFATVYQEYQIEKETEGIFDAQG